MDQAIENLSLKADKKKSEKGNKQPKQQGGKQGGKQDAGKALIGITSTKATDFPGWYQQIVTKGEMLDYYDVSGCYIMRPASYSVWEKIQDFFNQRIKSIGVQNAYFPMFVSSRVLEREKDHVEGFAPEVAWVTRAGTTELEEPIAIRPTSETVMYPYYAKWIRSHRDLPLRLNQWNSVVRWEFKHPQPFLRTREFLWQEGHTAHLTRQAAEEEVLTILDWYADIYQEVLAVPMIKGRKTENEKFAGSLYSASCEGFVPSTGRGIQGATSHCLGQNFSKMFNIVVEDPDADPAATEKAKIHVWQNSWGFSTRSIGVMIMVHSDDKGLVLPPRAAQTQIVIIPAGLTVKTSEEDRQKVLDTCKSVESSLAAAGVRVQGDYRLNYSPGWKFADCELRGVCARIEIGPKDVEKASCVAVRRDTGEKQILDLAAVSTAVPQLLETMHQDMYNKAKKEFDEHIKTVLTVDEMPKYLNTRNICLAPFCGDMDCEEGVKESTKRQATADEAEDDKAPSMGAKSLCTPFDQPELPEGQKCCNCSKPAAAWTLFGRSY